MFHGLVLWNDNAVRNWLRAHHHFGSAAYICSMERKIKLIWDFRGPASQKTAEHHEIHLREYIDSGKLLNRITGTDAFGDMHAVAWMVVDESEMISVRDALRPHRGEVYEG